MLNSKSSEAYELYNIYAALRRLSSIQQASNHELAKSQLDVSLFTNKFLLKLLDNRLLEIDSLCKELVSGLFKRLRKKNKLVGEPPKCLNNNSLQLSKCLELDEFFHYALYYLHDFFIELKWHNTTTDWTPGESEYARTKLNAIQDFFEFQGALNGSTRDNLGAKSLKDSKPSPKEVSHSFTKSPKSIKSTIVSSSRLDSPSSSLKRRVRFRDSSPDDDKSQRITGFINHDFSETHSIFALDLLLYALNLFARHLYGNLLDWHAQVSGLKDSLQLIRESKQKIRSNQLESMSKQIKISNDVYLTALDYLFDMRKIYLKNYIVNIICSREKGHQVNLYKSRRISTFIRDIVSGTEKRILSDLASQCLQILLDLMISEINLPPVELNAGTHEKTKVEVGRSRENYLNFIASWLNVDDIVFGFAVPKRRSSSSKVDATKHLNEPSTLATGGQFKSSSRILAQMDNLNELMRDLFNEVCNRIQSPNQLKYFLELVYAGLDISFDSIVDQLESQLSVARVNDNLSSTIPMMEVPKDLKVINRTVDVIAFKVRSLKFIHVLSSVDKLIKETASGHKVELLERPLSVKLEDFANKCTQQTGSAYKS